MFPKTFSCEQTTTARSIRLSMIAMISTVLFLGGCTTSSWRDASRASANIAPLPSEVSEPIVQVYAADAWGWRGIFAVHTWISVKPADADNYTVLEVIGWRAKRGLSVLRIEQDIPDRHWFGAEPELVYEKRGEEASLLIEKILHAANEYPWSNEYSVFPGPNSNTFPAWIAAQVPEFDLDLPFRAIGSGWAD